MVSPIGQFGPTCLVSRLSKICLSLSILACRPVNVDLRAFVKQFRAFTLRRYLGYDEEVPAVISKVLVPRNEVHVFDSFRINSAFSNGPKLYYIRMQNQLCLQQF